MQRSAFRATRLTLSTFLVKEHNDVFAEHPHIYVKSVPFAKTMLVIDTGTGGKTNEPGVVVKSLRRFIEEVGVPDNDHRPLNSGGLLTYIVVTTHCHYDHILGIEQFNDSLVLASAHSKHFISPSNLPQHSLCETVHLKTPKYTPKLVPHGYTLISPVHPHIPLNISILHTPGHTPDELAVYDADEMMLYVGDSLYEHEQIIFPHEGSIRTWFDSMDYLISFVEEQERESKIKQGADVKQVMINAGHQTVLKPALETLSGARAFIEDAVSGRENVKGRLTVRGEVNVVYEQAGGRFSLRCPERLISEARRNN